MTERLPWVTELITRAHGRLRFGYASTLKAAMNKIDHPYRSGRGIVRNFVTDEEWVRKDGTWSMEAGPNLRPMSRERARAG